LLDTGNNKGYAYSSISLAPSFIGLSNYVVQVFRLAGLPVYDGGKGKKDSQNRYGNEPGGYISYIVSYISGGKIGGIKKST